MNAHANVLEPRPKSSSSSTSPAQSCHQHRHHPRHHEDVTKQRKTQASAYVMARVIKDSGKQAREKERKLTRGYVLTS
eukprot:3688551-Rhodomonas_salina.2